jgi:hypothetical protein
MARDANESIVEGGRGAATNYRPGHHVASSSRLKCRAAPMKRQAEIASAVIGGVSGGDERGTKRGSRPAKYYNL